MLKKLTLTCSILVSTLLLVSAPALCQQGTGASEDKLPHVVIGLDADGSATLGGRTQSLEDFQKDFSETVTDCGRVVFDLVIEGDCPSRHVEQLISSLRSACAQVPAGAARFQLVSFGLQGGAAHLGKALMVPGEGYPPTQIEIGQVLTIGLSMGGRASVGKNSGAIPELKAAVANQLSKNENLIVLIDPHPDTAYKDYYEALRMVKLAGATKISLWGSNSPIELVDYSKNRKASAAAASRGASTGGQYDVEPQLIYKVPVEYPKTALDGGVQGSVQVMAFINELGTVFKVRVIQSTAPKILMDAATEAVMKFRFSPAEKDGQPVKSTLVIPIDFKWDAKKAAIN